MLQVLKIISMLFSQLIWSLHIVKPCHNNQDHRKRNIVATRPLLSEWYKLLFLCLVLRDYEPDSGSFKMLVLDFLKMMVADFVVSLWTCLCIYGNIYVFDFLHCSYVHCKLIYASLWDTCHVICAGTRNFFDTLHHCVSLYLVIFLKTNTENSNLRFSILEICLLEPPLQISGK